MSDHVDFEPIELSVSKVTLADLERRRGNRRALPVMGQFWPAGSHEVAVMVVPVPGPDHE